MDIRKLQRAIVDGLEDVKAQHIAVFNTEALSPLFERVIVATGASNRQTKALAASVRDAVRSRGMQVMRIEGEENGEWIIVDCGAAVVHIMQPAIREYYHLEEIWGGKPVRMKVGTRSGALVKASEGPDDESPAAPPARARGAAPKAGGAPGGSRAAAAAKPRRPSTPRQPASRGKVRTVVVGQPAAKRPAARGAKAAGGRAAGAAKRRG
jgi:ribosome-associated protein